MRTDLEKWGFFHQKEDMITVYKMFEGYDDLKMEDFFEVETESKLRGHSRKLKVKYCRTDSRKFFFSHRVIKLWNK